MRIRLLAPPLTLGMTLLLIHAAPIAQAVPARPAVAAAPATHVKVLGKRTYARPGSPPRAAENYAKLEKLFAADPQSWGGAYVDGDVLVVKTVGQPAARTATALRALGIGTANSGGAGI